MDFLYMNIYKSPIRTVLKHGCLKDLNVCIQVKVEILGSSLLTLSDILLYFV